MAKIVFQFYNEDIFYFVTKLLMLDIFLLQIF